MLLNFQKSYSPLPNPPHPPPPPLPAYCSTHRMGSQISEPSQNWTFCAIFSCCCLQCRQPAFWSAQKTCADRHLNHEKLAAIRTLDEEGTLKGLTTRICKCRGLKRFLSFCSLALSFLPHTSSTTPNFLTQAWLQFRQSSVATSPYFMLPIFIWK